MAMAYVLIVRVGSFDLRDLDDVVAANSGGVVMGLIMARRFGRFHGGGTPLRQRSDESAGAV